jgi:hypothetical protein
VLALVFALIAIAGVAFLYIREKGVFRPRTNLEPDQVMLQAGRLYALMNDYGGELQAVARQANYPDNEEKEKGKKAVSEFLANLETVRLAQQELIERRDRASLLQFVFVACGFPPLSGRCMNFQTPNFSKFVPGTFQNGRYVEGKTVGYANAARLESMQDEFMVLLTEMLKTAK